MSHVFSRLSWIIIGVAVVIAISALMDCLGIREINQAKADQLLKQIEDTYPEYQVTATNVVRNFYDYRIEAILIEKDNPSSKIKVVNSEVNGMKQLVLSKNYR